SGFPVVTCNPAAIQAPDGASDEVKAKFAAVKREIDAIAPNIKINKQAGVTLYTSPYRNVGENGDLTYTDIMQLKVELLTPSGGSAVDYDSAIRSHEMGIARSVLATFLMMGGEGTSGAQNGVGSQFDAFVTAAKANLDALAITLSSQLIPMLWKWNGLDEQYMPKVRAGRIDRASIESLGRFVESLARAGIPVSDPETQEHLRLEAGLPIPESINDVLK
ncbi:phage portal protein family protein, partial [Klebsiella pneumoniae]